MSYKAYEKAIKKAKKGDDFDCGTPHSDEVIKRAESAFGATSDVFQDVSKQFG